MDIFIRKQLTAYSDVGYTVFREENNVYEFNSFSSALDYIATIAQYRPVSVLLIGWTKPDKFTYWNANAHGWLPKTVAHIRGK